jgi:hypothetical protein
VTHDPNRTLQALVSGLRILTRLGIGVPEQLLAIQSSNALSQPSEHTAYGLSLLWLSGGS